MTLTVHDLAVVAWTLGCLLAGVASFLILAVAVAALRALRRPPYEPKRLAHPDESSIEREHRRERNQRLARLACDGDVLERVWSRPW